MSTNSGGLHVDLQLLGIPRLGGKPLEPIRAALLAYLALAGETSRAQLTQLLWPDKAARTARNNLAQQLVRLRKMHPEPCIVGEDPLRLADGLLVDVRLLHSAYAKKDHRAAVEHSGELLAGLELDADQHEALASWLGEERLRIRHLQCHAHEQEIERLTIEGDLREALELSQQLLALDDGMELAWYDVMFLHFLMGERSAALAVYDECKKVLRRKLDVEPSEEIRHLARQLEREDAALRRSPGTLRRPQLPLKVLCPPLVGREREWAELEEAWELRKPIFVFGEPGVGKTRLIEDFARSKGRWLRLEAMPGDRDVPYATHVRSGRKLLQQRRKDGRPPLPAWVAEQLAPLLPEAGVPGASSTAARGRIRFFDAVTELFRDTCKDLDVVVFDDGQYIDEPSFRLGIYLHNTIWLSREETGPGGKPFPPMINGYRGSAIEPRWLDRIQDLVNIGLVASIEVKPLSTPQVAELLRGMGVPELEARAGELARYTGGNPLYIVETVKHLLLTHERPELQSSVLSLADPVRKIIRTRLKALSATALDIARVVAVAQTNVSLELVSAVLDVPLLDLAEPYRELEEQGVLSQEWFTHDLLGEVLVEDMPGPVQASVRRLVEGRRNAALEAASRAITDR